MRSTCPSCLSQVEHTHSDPEVTCTSCGEKFSPFIAVGDGAENSGSSIHLETQSTPDFTESHLAFQEIVQFGETMEDPPPNSPNEPGSALAEKVAPTPSAGTPAAPSAFSSEELLITSGDGFLGLRIESWMSPISLWTTLDATNPLQTGLNDLINGALAVGANGVVGFQFSLSADGKRALLFGTPVRCQKT